MPTHDSLKFVYTIIPAQRLALLRFSGSVTLGDVIRGIERIRADPRYDPHFNGIVNMEGVTTRAGISELQALLSFLEKRHSSVGQWVVVFSEPKTTALGMMFKAAWFGPFNIEIVSTWEAACRFLRVQLPAYAPEG